MDAQLHILTGDEPIEIKKLLPYMTFSEREYILNSYPEMMEGLFTGIVSAAAAGIGAIVKGVKAKKEGEQAEQKALRYADYEQKAQEIIVNAKTRMETEQRNIILLSSIGLGIVLLLRGRKNRKRR